MKRLNSLWRALSIAILLALPLALAGCPQEDKPLEKAGDAIEEAADDIGDAAVDAKNKAKEQIEKAGDEIEDATDK